jgi:hypothetical protein
MARRPNRRRAAPARRRNPAYTTREIEPGKWGIVGPDGPTHKWFTSKARAEAWIDTNAGAEVKKWTGQGSQERFDFRGKTEQADKRTHATPEDDAATNRRAAAAERVKREAAEQAERIRQRHAAEAAERAAEAEAKREREREERLREWRAQRGPVRAAQSAQAEAAEQAQREAEERQRERTAWNEKMAEARRAAYERGQKAEAEREAREAHMRSEEARAEAERDAREAQQRHQAREKAAKDEQERERAESDRRREAREQERTASDDRREKAAKEHAKKQRTAREGKSKTGAGKAPKVEWVHVGVNTWAGFETVDGKDRALFTGVQKASANWFTKRRGEGPKYQVIGTAPLGVYGYGVHERLKASGLRMDVAKNYGTFPTLEDARKAAIAEDRRLQGDPGFHQDRADADRAAAEKQRQRAEQEAARERAHSDRVEAENQRAAARQATGPWTTSTHLTWSVTASTYGSAAHAVGPDGKALFCFAYRRNNAPAWDIYTVKGDLIGRSREPGAPKDECAAYAARHLRTYALHHEPWPPRFPPRWQEVRDRLEAGYKRQEDDARRQSGYGGGSYRSAPPPPAGLHGFKRYADLARMAAPGSGGSDNERALAARLMAKMQAEWDAASGADREGLRAKWHRQNPRPNPGRRHPQHRRAR